MAKIEIKKGSKVMWAGSWGTDKPKVAKIRRIERTAKKNEKYGRERPSMTWNTEKNDWQYPFIADLENGRWAYSTQLKPIM